MSFYVNILDHILGIFLFFLDIEQSKHLAGGQ